MYSSERAKLTPVDQVKVSMHITKCIYTIYYLNRKKKTVNSNYVDLIRFFAAELQEPITKPFLYTCPKNAT